MRFFLEKIISKQLSTPPQKYAFTFLLGSIMTLSLPPLGIFPVLLISVPGLIILSQRAKTKLSGFLTGWVFGAGYFIFGLYWVSAALFVDFRQWGWVLPLSLIIGPALLALFYGFIPLLAHPFRDSKLTHALSMVAAWSVIEYLRGHLFTGFPWNLPGYTWDHVLPVMQTSAYVGIYGLTLLTLFWAAIPAFIENKKPTYTAIVILLVCVFGGKIRLYMNPTHQSGHNTIRVVQPNIPQKIKWNLDEDWRNLSKHLLLSKEKTTLDDPVTFVVWPETAVLADLDLFPETGRYIALNMPQGSIGIIGTLRATADEKYYNSVTAVGAKGKVLGVYDKHHLVPFGEYIPWRDVLNITPVAAAISNVGDFTRGDEIKTIKAGNAPSFSPLICYEAIFPGQVARKDQRPDFLVNVTNDGWYGRTAGPYQHLAIVRVRAIEEGLPLVRAANTGISAVIDPVGRYTARMPLQTMGAVDTILPAPVSQTLYARFGDKTFFLLLAFFVIGIRITRSFNN